MGIKIKIEIFKERSSFSNLGRSLSHGTPVLGLFHRKRWCCEDPSTLHFADTWDITAWGISCAEQMNLLTSPNLVFLWLTWLGPSLYLLKKAINIRQVSLPQAFGKTPHQATPYHHHSILICIFYLTRVFGMPVTYTSFFKNTHTQWWKLYMLIITF